VKCLPATVAFLHHGFRLSLSIKNPAREGPGRSIRSAISALATLLATLLTALLSTLTALLTALARLLGLLSALLTFLIALLPALLATLAALLTALTRLLGLLAALLAALAATLLTTALLTATLAALLAALVLLIRHLRFPFRLTHYTFNNAALRRDVPSLESETPLARIFFRNAGEIVVLKLHQPRGHHENSTDQAQPRHNRFERRHRRSRVEEETR